MCTPGGGGCLRDRGPHRNKTNLDWSCLVLWFEAASEQQASSKNKQTALYNLFTSLPRGTRSSASQDFFYFFFSLPFFTLPLHAVAYRVQLKSHSPTEVIYFPLTNWWAMMLRPAHTLFNTFSSGIAGNIQPVWSERGFFFSFSFCRANSSSVLEVADR